MAPASNSSALSDPEFEMVNHIINTKELENLKWSECSIYRVPCNLRKVNKEAYTPQLISIGPLHHGRKELKPMQEQKKKYFHFFWERVSKESNEQALKNYRGYLEREEQVIRQRYAKNFSYIGKDKFVDMILLDAVFIVELFLRTRSCKSGEQGHGEDNILTQSWLSKSIHRDLLLLENQLPMSVLITLYDTVVPNKDKEKLHHANFLGLAHDYFAFYCTQKQGLAQNQSKHCNNSIRRLKKSLDELNELMMMMHEQQSLHFTDLIRYFYLPTKLENSVPSPSFHRTAKKLQEAGVSFEKVLDKRLLDIKFERKALLSWFLCFGCLPYSKYFEAHLQIPQLKVDHTTECVLRNLIAFEQCHYPLQPYICNYVSLLDSLIHTKDDVELLVEKEVIVHELGSDKEVATLVNGLCKHVVAHATCYGQVMDELNKHYQNIWNRSMATLRLVYFRDPWRASSTVVGIAVLVFTIFNFCRVIRVVF